MSVALDYNSGAVVRVQSAGGYTGDPDWTLTQDYAAAEAAGTVTFPANRGVGALAVTVEAYTAAGVPVAGDRGVFTLSPVRLLRGVVHDGSAALPVGAWRRVIIGDSAGAPSAFGVRISSVTLPAGTAELRVFMEVLRGNA